MFVEVVNDNNIISNTQSQLQPIGPQIKPIGPIDNTRPTNTVFVFRPSGPSRPRPVAFRPTQRPIIFRPPNRPSFSNPFTNLFGLFQG